MWAYRFDRPYSVTSVSLTRDNISHHLIAAWGRIEFESATKRALDLCRHIDWDGTFGGPTRYFTVPGVHELMLGWMFYDVQGRTFIVSPISFPHLASVLDWDAMVSHDEIDQARRAIRTGEIEHKALMTQNWRATRNGNIFGKINGAAVTIFAVANGYKAIVNPIGKSPIYTRVVPDVNECCKYVLENWYTIIDPPDPSGGPIEDDELDW